MRKTEGSERPLHSGSKRKKPGFVIAKIHPKGQVVIPKDVRDLFNLNPGDKVEIRTNRDGIVLLPLNGRMTATELFRGGFKGPLGLEDLERLYHERRENP